MSSDITNTTVCQSATCFGYIKPDR